ncbi:haloacid dehalogenase-like hydrolase [Roseovarius albus]|uniref:Haloacid dehalogenase-like hydrolase n=1 Tax=Roseovarius albus TaxID=1247867 RepID=A0A1X6ZGS4_9RHOB|nr:pyrimidine 5'-nucleotidase [Roseovarius albus]SLN50678.1 haloacid dehalogenase-like hydrolase [Roseovarius albus]
MPKQHFTHVDTWVFDLDNTLYPPRVKLFDQIETRMTQYVMEQLQVPRDEADRIRYNYWRTHGTTLAGLMREHDLDPGPYLSHVHDICFDELEPDQDLRGRIDDLPGRKIVYTNGCAPYAQKVLERRGLGGAFDAVYGVENAGFLPKPERAAFEAIFTQDGVDPSKAAMFEDDPRNLAQPYAMGMRTILVAEAEEDADFIHHHTDDLTKFLSVLTG